MPDGTTSLQIARTQKPVSVRVAGPADEAALLNLFIDAHADNEFAHMDIARMAEWARIFTHHPDGNAHSVVGIIDGVDGALSGCVGLVLFQPWFSADWAIQEQVLFVRPEARAMQASADLMTFCLWFAEKLGLPLYIGVRSKDRIAAKNRLMGEHFTPCGGLFYYDGAQRP